MSRPLFCASLVLIPNSLLNITSTILFSCTIPVPFLHILIDLALSHAHDHARHNGDEKSAAAKSSTTRPTYEQYPSTYHKSTLEPERQFGGCDRCSGSKVVMERRSWGCGLTRQSSPPIVKCCPSVLRKTPPASIISNKGNEDAKDFLQQVLPVSHLKLHP
ncbi:hypothetical protein V8F33_004086 [Rhypophila sp. PSN 637]